MSMTEKVSLVVVFLFRVTYAMTPAPSNRSSQPSGQSLSSSPPKQNHLNLQDHLFDSSRYRKEIRPIEDDSNSLSVYMRFRLLSLVEVREKDQTIVSIGELEMTWTDYLLTWNATEYGGIETVLVEQQNVWLPDVVVANSVSPQDQLGYDELPVRLFYPGTVSWKPSALITTSCNIEVTFYPFDTQSCDIEFETAMSRSTEIDININPDSPINTGNYNENGQWTLVKTSSENLNAQGLKSKIRYKLLLQRRTTFYIVNMILPVLFLAMMSSLMFALPASGGEKITIGITVLLAYAVYLTIVSGQLPNTSVQTSFLAIYLTTLLGVSSLSVITAVAIVRLHHKPETEPVGPKTRSLANFLAKATCSALLPEVTATTRKNCIVPEDEINSPQKDADEYSKKNLPSQQRVLSRIGHSTNQEVTWHDIAKVADWFCFLFYSVVTLLITLVTIMVLVLGSAINNPTIAESVAGTENSTGAGSQPVPETYG